MKVSCLNNISNVGLKLFTSKYEIVEEPSRSDLLLVRSFKMHDYEINDNLLAVARAGAGVNNIPLSKMADAGVVVFNAPGGNANAVKELVIAGMLLASRNIVGGINWVQNNADDEELQAHIEKVKKTFAGSEIQGKTISVIGLGHVGGKVANICIELGLKVFGYDPYISDQARKSLKPGVEITEDLDMIYETSDFISLHLPLLDSTKEFINQDVFKKMKPGMVLLNYSRDLLVDDKSLKEALEEGIVSKYVTDFPNQFVANLDNVIAIPHLGASTEESEENCAVMAVHELMNYVERGDIQNSVNYPNVILGEIAGKSRLLILAKNEEGMTEAIDKALKPVEKTIETSVSKTRNNYAVFAFDFKAEVPEKIINELRELPDITKVRII